MMEKLDENATHDSEAGQMVENAEYNLAEQHDQLARGLKSRHIQFLALGGAIGTGLFIGSGGILSSTGPAPLFMAYLSMMMIVWVVMNCLAEMVTYLPMRGITVPYFVDRFVDPSLGFAAGWNYWYAYAILIGAEATAAGIIIDYWGANVNIAVWITIVLAVILFLNIIAVSFFGEAEFWFASIKLITIMGLIILGIVIFFGGAPKSDGVLGFHYWKDPGAFVEYKAPGSTGRFLGYWHAFVSAGFAFITSPELIAIAAGETIAPRRNIPKAARRFVWRLAIFYGLGSLVIGIMVPSNDPQLLNAEKADASASPFVIGIQNVGIPTLNHIINAAILTSAWSAGNSFLYSGSRILYSMALSGQAPKLFRITNRNGVPWVAVLATWSIGLLAYLNVSNSGAEVFTWFTNISTISGFVAWIIVMITYLRFRRAMIYNNLFDSLPYKTPLQPYATYATLGVVSILTITNGFQTFMPFSAKNFVAAYITLPIFFILYIGHKIWFRTSLYIPVDQIDAITGKKEMDELEATEEPRIAKNWLQKVWYWLA
ncbi:amino acid permease family protein [Metarhizium robertsii]|uniref:Amino-acid permease inda1 n=2 Tax=Metarhizium robertsii TaxID=568076 RepID=E9EM75_METRA|nr:amino-acid permease inda1 [Metarhizium robertsii ARSEF 23]EFZ04503.1 amino-acid permease inda1 [Metarhizium robertsii ARSEF 23]EXV00297.1 amino acid permease family protein [Metarhizium robertsii]